MPKLKRPSLKQRKFAKAYVENGGNAGKAALIAYDVSSNESARKTGQDALDNPMVQEEIKKLLNRAGLDLDTLNDKSKNLLDDGLSSKPSFAAATNHLQFLYKLHGVSPVNKSASIKWSSHQQLPSNDITQLTEALTKLNKSTSKLLTLASK